MDKQKQILGMAKIYCQNGFRCEENCQTNGCRVYEVCTELYIAGYRKIPENAVVLTREEFDKKLEPFRLEIISLSQELIETSQKLMKARKETAEKFAEVAKEAIINMKWARDDTHIKLVTQGDCLKAIDEICKEITEGQDGNYKQDCRLDSKRKL